MSNSLRMLTLVASFSFTACATSSLPPALPEEPLVLGPGWTTPAAQPVVEESPPVALTTLVPVLSAPPPLQAVPPTPPPRSKPVRLEPPDRIIRDANKDALVTPSRQGYFGARAEQRYIYQPGKVYLVISSPNHPTTLILPPGERLAAPPVLNTCTDQDADTACWTVGTAEIGSETTRSEVVILRPGKAGLESTMPLLTQGGRAYYVRLRSQEGVGMVSVTWELSTLQVLPPTQEAKPAASLQTEGPRPLQAPQIALSRLHTTYTIAVVGKQRPPWVPTEAFDDGSKTYIRFGKGNLEYTAAPAVFGVHSDQTPAIVEFIPYTTPEGGLTYIVPGLYPELRLKGTDGQEVKITRGANAH